MKDHLIIELFYQLNLTDVLEIIHIWRHILQSIFILALYT